MPQDYGGFSLLSEQQQHEITELVFGSDGLQVEIIKMFLDPYHQTSPEGDFDHETTTSHMRSFVQKGLKIARDQGKEIEILTTLYGPPPWATAQKFIGGRDLDTSETENLIAYMVDWVKYLKENNYPVKYLSIHNEGEDFYRWDFQTGKQRLEQFDFNMYWPPQQVNNFLKKIPSSLESAGMSDIKVTNGEPSNWTRFYHWGYANALADDEDALNELGLLTTHGFINGNMNKLSFSSANDLTTTMIRKKKPDLHAWITSMSWGSSGIHFLRMVHENIYSARVNAIIPWAGIQHPKEWINGDPNPGTAIQVDSTGNYSVTNWYYYYKQLTRAGHRGTSVVHSTLSNPQAFIIAFGQNGSPHPDAFVSKQ